MYCQCFHQHSTTHVFNPMERPLASPQGYALFICRVSLESFSVKNAAWIMNHLKLNHLRILVTLVLSVMFLYSVVTNFTKYKEKKTVVAPSVKSAAEVVYPSVTLCPLYKHEYALSIIPGSKNLTEYYDIITNLSLIRKDIKRISQPYTTKNG